ncbi:glycosyltransferase family 2 protein [Bacillus massiliigorillae]|uniref:glycosyltransferase family 2 protein n=1 Tax=Bacillus massiliigorillae TaxID=1243664 RepID=UPI00039D74E9|nr:glycosyltransferase [Bacillus massiliigorillae]
MTKISIIVPIYNMEKCLQRSIESIQRQIFLDLEIILVNDGSTDNSLSICEELQQNDNRIKVINQKNEGVSSARNAGIAVADGEYIGFVDPDDWIKPEMYNNMYNLMEKIQADICMCSYVKEQQGKSTAEILKINKTVLKKNEIPKIIVADMIGNISLNSGLQPVMGSVCRLLIKKELIKRNNLKFEMGIPLMEDLIFCVQLFLKSDLVCIDRGLYYHYMMNSNSAVTSYRANITLVQKDVYKKLESVLKEEKVFLVLKIE